MNSQITLRDHIEEHLPFKFQGFWNEGNCFLRIVIKEKKVVFLCCQLPEYMGTSITNAVESIWSEAIEQLFRARTDCGERVLEISTNLTILEKIFKSKQAIEQESKQDFLTFVSRNSIWIEHYPTNVGLADNGSYAIVQFSEGGEPTWNYVSKEHLQNKLPDVDLDVSIEVLHQWK